MIEDVIQYACEEWAIDRHQLLGPCRKADFVEARQFCFWVLHHELGISTGRIGKRFARDHTTIMHGVKSFKAKVASGQMEIPLGTNKFIDNLLESYEIRRRTMEDRIPAFKTKIKKFSYELEDDIEAAMSHNPGKLIHHIRECAKEAREAKE